MRNKLVHRRDALKIGSAAFALPWPAMLAGGGCTTEEGAVLYQVRGIPALGGNA